MKRYLFPILLALAALVFVITHFLWLEPLPEKLATHFNAAGKANGWMSRRSHSIFMLMMGLGLPTFIIVLCSAMRFLPPSLMNVPRPEYWKTPEHYPEACRIMQRWAQAQGLALLIWMTFLNHEIVKANLLKPPHLSSTNTWVLTGAFVFGTAMSIAWLFWRFLKRDAV